MCWFYTLNAVTLNVQKICLANKLFAALQKCCKFHQYKDYMKKSVAIKKEKTADQKNVLVETNLKKNAKKQVVTKADSKTAKKKSNKVEPEKLLPAQTKTSRTSKSSKKMATKVTFQLKYHTQYGQSIFITANHPLFGNGNIKDALPLHYFNDEFWYTSLEINETDLAESNIVYNYFIKNNDGTIVFDCGHDKALSIPKNVGELLIIDAWNYAGYIENAFYTEPFQQVLLKNEEFILNKAEPKNFTHTFSVKAPLLKQNQTLCLLGSCDELSNWETASPLLMKKKKGETQFKIKVNLSKVQFPIAYKFGVFDLEENKFLYFEDGNNRILYDSVSKNKQTIVNHAFAVLPSTTWKGAGVAIPVFSLRTENSFGIGEFTDLKLLVDWSKKVGLKLIQILPVNDTTATHSNADSYPYAAISAFALHPAYLNLQQMTEVANKKHLDKLETTRKKLNAQATVDYANVLHTKWEFIKKIYPLQKAKTFASEEYKTYFNQNKHWLIPYAVFCYLRDEYGTANYNNWPAYKTCRQSDIDELTAKKSDAFDDIAIHYFVQYHLHLQLKAATDYAHQNGIIVKGDIAIGIYRFGTDAWQNPELYNMNVQAGAPPDDFAVKGQNWGFPTYNWQRMKEDGFAWWKQRFEQMSYYFDAFRIDHILGFFRIWSIPVDAVEGILGYFVPAIPIHINEFNEKGIWFDNYRYTQPYINETVLWSEFGSNADYVKEHFLIDNGTGGFSLKEEFNTQVKVEKHFAALEVSEFNLSIKYGLFNLISNVILFEEEGSQGQKFHFRFGIESTLSFQHLEYNTKQQLKELYVDYFFRRQDDFWMKEALQKLPALKRVTNMLICGEDLGLVPSCVPDVMQQLGLLSLEIQRMPKDSSKEFFHPHDAPYLSVVTPSTHDMSTIRGWWEEDRAKTQKFFNKDLGQNGDAPAYCEAWVNKAIVVQHLFSPAMWSVFQLQDLMGIDDGIRRENPNDERINVPANPKHYWCYRMHLSLEDLIANDTFNNELKKSIQLSGR